MAEENNIPQEVKEALTTAQDQITLETIQSEDSSPLNSPVIEKDIGGEKQTLEQEGSETWNVWKPKNEGNVSEIETQQETTDYRKEVEQELETEKEEEPLDAPEQEISGGGQYDDNGETITDKDFEIPLAQANQAATAILGMTNNVLTAGGGYFVKIKKHEEFYEFNEIIDVIDSQNQKNVNRIILDKEDKALLRPLLAEVIRKKAKKLTPEQQLMGAVASILLKKGQTVMEIRSENTLLENRLVNIIKEQKKELVSEESYEKEAVEDYKQDFEPIDENNEAAVVEDHQETTAEKVSDTTSKE